MHYGFCLHTLFHWLTVKVGNRRELSAHRKQQRQIQNILQTLQRYKQYTANDAVGHNYIYKYHTDSIYGNHGTRFIKPPALK